MGILIRYGAGIVADSSRKRIESVEIAPMIMRDLGVEEAQAPPKARERRRVLTEHAFA